jgi:hypothetical protein
LLKRLCKIMFIWIVSSHKPLTQDKLLSLFIFSEYFINQWMNLLRIYLCLPKIIRFIHLSISFDFWNLALCLVYILSVIYSFFIKCVIELRISLLNLIIWFFLGSNHSMRNIIIIVITQLYLAMINLIVKLILNWRWWCCYL